MFAGIAFVYLYFFPYFPTLNNPNENTRVYQIRSLVELGKFSINEQIQSYGYVNDLGVRDGKYYSVKGPATTYIGLPIFGLLRAYDHWQGHSTVSNTRAIYALRLLGTLLPTLGFIWLFRMYIRRFVMDDVVADVLALIMALGSMLITYSLIYVNHSLSAATAFGVLMATDAAVRARQRVGQAKGTPIRSWWWLALAGFLVASTAALDFALLPAAMVLLVSIPWRFGWSWASTAGVCVGGSIPAIWTAVYNTICWGGPFKLGHRFLDNPTFMSNHQKGFFGLVGPSRDAVYGIVVSPSKGLLYLTPVFGLALLATIHAGFRSKWRKEAILCAVFVWLLLLYACSLINWDGGWTVGPRYATALVPFAIFGMGLSWAASGRRGRWIVLPLGVGLGILGMLSMTLTSVLFPHIPPEYKNPFFEVIWPLWRDALSPMNFGERWFGLSGRGAQLPFLVVFGSLVLYAFWAAGGWGVSSLRRPLWASATSSLFAVLVIALGLWCGKIPRSDSQETVRSGTSWIRDQVWYPNRWQRTRH